MRIVRDILEPLEPGADTSAPRLEKMEDGRLIVVRAKTGELLEIVNQAVAKEFVSLMLMELNPRPLRLQFCNDNGKGFYINSVSDFERLLAQHKLSCLEVDLQIDEESQFEGILAASLFDAASTDERAPVGTD